MRTRKRETKLALAALSFGALFLIWLGLSGHAGLLFILLGLASAAFAAWTALRMTPLARLKGLFRPSLQILSYPFWLSNQIARANIAVARIILSPSLPISPCILKTPSPQKSDVATAIFANSITLTPGTVAVETQGDHILVHALTTPQPDSLAEMSDRVSALEKRNPQ